MTIHATFISLIGGAATGDIHQKGKIGGVILPCSSRGYRPETVGTRGGSLQARTNQRDGRDARRAGRENGPAGPVLGASVRDKEKP